MKICFYFDENVDTDVAHGLRMRGIDVITVDDLGLKGTNDYEHLSRSTREKRVLVTHDMDFLRIHSEGYKHSGIVYCHLHKYTVGKMIFKLIDLTRNLDLEDFHNRLIYL